MPESRARKPHQHATRSNLDRAIVRDGCRCHWCRRPLVLIRKIPRRDRIAVDRHTITYRLGGIHVVALFATADHVVPLWQGGRSTLANIVPSCAQCNLERNQEARQKRA